MNFIRSFLISFLATFLFSSYTWATPVFGPVDMGAFYQSLPTVNPNDKLGKLIKAEKIETPIANAQAWKIAYISSDVLGNKTLATGIIVAPKGKKLKMTGLS